MAEIITRDSEEFKELAGWIKKAGKAVEIYMDADETIVLKKYSQVGSLKNISQAYAQSLSKVTGAMVFIWEGNSYEDLQ